MMRLSPNYVRVKFILSENECKAIWAIEQIKDDQYYFTETNKRGEIVPGSIFIVDKNQIVWKEVATMNLLTGWLYL